MKGSEILEIVDNICEECYTIDDEEFKGKRCKNCVISKIKNDIKALEQADKYKWHDLRESPNDLPEEGAKVFCQHYPKIWKDKKLLCIEHIYQENDFRFNWDMELDFKSTNFGEYYMGEVFAWKYSNDEPFESEKE